MNQSSDRTGEVWELTYAGMPAEMLLILSSHTEHTTVHSCLVLANAYEDHDATWKAGWIVSVGEWGFINDDRRKRIA